MKQIYSNAFTRKQSKARPYSGVRYASTFKIKPKMIVNTKWISQKKMDLFRHMSGHKKKRINYKSLYKIKMQP